MAKAYSSDVCDFPWRYVYFSVKGALGYCCVFPQIVANMDEITSFEEFWNSPKMQHTRTLFLANKHRSAGCYSGCPVLLRSFPEYSKDLAIPAKYNPDEVTGDQFLDAFPASSFDRPTTYEENQALIKREIAQGIAKVNSYPTRLHLETNSFCNLRCPMCIIGQVTDWELVSLSDDFLNKIQPLYKYLEYIEMQGGESIHGKPETSVLMRVIDDIAAAANPNLTCLITTNGIGLNPKWTDYLLSKNVVTDLVISIDTANPATYEKVRKRGRLDVLERNLAYLCERKAALGLSKPEIIFSSIISAETYKDLSLLDSFGKKFGVKHVNFIVLTPSGNANDRYFEPNNIFTDKHYNELTQVRRELSKITIPSNKDYIVSVVSDVLVRQYAAEREEVLKQWLDRAFEIETDLSAPEEVDRDFDVRPPQYTPMVRNAAPGIDSLCNSAGLLVEGDSSNLLLNSLSPETHSLELAPGTYTLSAHGKGSCEVSLVDDAVATADAPLTFGIETPAQATFKVSGDLVAFQCEPGAVATSIIPTLGGVASRSASLVTARPNESWQGPEGTLIIELVGGCPGLC